MRNSESMDIHELVDLLAVPQVKETIFFKLSALKEKFAGLIESYQQRKEMFRQVSFDNLQDHEKQDESGKNKLYWFEVVRYRAGDVRIVKMEPAVPPYYNPSEILPEDVMDQLFDAPFAPGKVSSLMNVKSHLFDLFFDLRFIRFNESHVVGTVKENPFAEKERYKNQVYTANEKMDMAYQVFFYYMKKFPVVRDYLFNEFFGKILPVLEEEEKVHKSA